MVETTTTSAIESGTKQVMHHGRLYGIVEYFKNTNERMLRNCTLEFVYDALMCSVYTVYRMDNQDFLISDIGFATLLIL